MTDWHVYILQCADESYYTGITTDLERRLREHNQGVTGSKYTRTRLPVKIIYSEFARNRSIASRREWEIKKLSKHKKRQLIEQAND